MKFRHAAPATFAATLAAAAPGLAIAQVAQPLGPQLAIAHRGASAYAPEHTLFAYDLALAMDVDMLECDAQITADRVVVCIHDTTVDRTSDATGDVGNYTLAQLREQDFGSWRGPAFAAARIVPFEEQLDCYLRHNPRMRFHVETKDSAGGLAEAAIAGLLQRKGLVDTGDIASSTIVMQSFDAASLERMKQLAPTLPTAFLFTAPAGESLVWVLTGDGPDYIDAFAPTAAVMIADALMITRMHLFGHHVHTWTVNTRSQMDLVLTLGVDGVFSNNPDLIRAAINARGTGTTVEHRGNPAAFAHGCAGIAGRVRSGDGPGDTWTPAPGGHGVRQVSAYAADTLPDAFAIPAVVAARPGRRVESAVIEVSGLEAAAPLRVRGAGLRYSVSGRPWQRGAAVLAPGDTLRLQARSPAAGASDSYRVTIGGLTVLWEVETRGR